MTAFRHFLYLKPFPPPKKMPFPIKKGSMRVDIRCNTRDESFAGRYDRAEMPEPPDIFKNRCFRIAFGRLSRAKYARIPNIFRIASLINPHFIHVCGCCAFLRVHTFIDGELNTRHGLPHFDLNISGARRTPNSNFKF